MLPFDLERRGGVEIASVQLYGTDLPHRLGISSGVKGSRWNSGVGVGSSQVGDRKAPLTGLPGGRILPLGPWSSGCGLTTAWLDG